MVFHDFDYINPVTMLPEGRTLDQMAQLNKSLNSFNSSNPYGANQTARNNKNFGATGMSSVAGKSIYVVSEMGSEGKSPLNRSGVGRLGGHKTPLRALQNV